MPVFICWALECSAVVNCTMANKPSQHLIRLRAKNSVWVARSLLAIISGEDSIYDDNGRTSIGDGDSPATENVEVTANGNQLDGGVVATFFNTLHRNIRIFQVHPETGRQIQLSQSIPPGRSGRLIVRPADVLIAYDGHGVAVKKFLVEGFNDGRMDFSME